jgi:uncharacterized protein with HEPN domain
MKRDEAVYLSGTFWMRSAKSIRTCSASRTSGFAQQSLIQDAVILQLEVIGDRVFL